MISKSVKIERGSPCDTRSRTSKSPPPPLPPPAPPPVAPFVGGAGLPVWAGGGLGLGPVGRVGTAEGGAGRVLGCCGTGMVWPLVCSAGRGTVGLTAGLPTGWLPRGEGGLVAEPPGVGKGLLPCACCGLGRGPREPLVAGLPRGCGGGS